jgi:hypothetical protein
MRTSEHVLLPSSTSKASPYITIFLGGGFEQWAYLECSHTKWLSDGRPLSLPEAPHDGSVSSAGGVVETRTMSSVSRNQIALRARAQKIACKGCNAEYSVSTAALEDLRPFFSKRKGLLPK